jgi:hypothetical protein
MIRYLFIEPLIESAVVDGSLLCCTFRCPVSGARVRAHVSIYATARDRGEAGLLGRLRRTVREAVQDVLGYGDRADREAGPVPPAAGDLTEEDRRAAVERAFHSVSFRFVWDEEGRRWVSAASIADALAGFARQLEAAPVVEPAERALLGRVLLDVARADSRVTEEEREFLEHHLALGSGPIELCRLTVPSREEMAPCREAVRETILMLAWALALSDYELAPAERDLLAADAHALGIAKERAAELRRYAQYFVLDRALEGAYQGGAGAIDARAHAEALALAGEIGLTDEEVQRVDVLSRRRYGLA